MGITVKLSGLVGLFGEVSKRSKDFTPATRQWYRMQRISIREEFRRESFFRQSGGSVRWEKSKSFGSRRAARRTLRRTGLLFNAATGNGRGHIKRVGPTSMSIGVSGAAVPHASILRGGTGQNLVRRKIVVKPKKLAVSKTGRTLKGAHKWAMYWFLGMRYGVWLKESTLRRGLRIPRRRWGVLTRKATQKMGNVAVEYIVDGKVAQPRLAEYLP